MLVVAAYLCLANLDYAALWHDEAPTALIGRNLLDGGDFRLKMVPDFPSRSRSKAPS